MWDEFLLEKKRKIGIDYGMQGSSLEFASWPFEVKIGLFSTKGQIQDLTPSLGFL